MLKASNFDDELSLGADGKYTHTHTHTKETNKAGNVLVGKSRMLNKLTFVLFVIVGTKTHRDGPICANQL